VYAAPYTEVFEDGDFLGEKQIASRSFDGEEYAPTISQTVELDELLNEFEKK